MAYLDGTDPYFDSRDVTERIAQLEAIEVIDREPEDQDELDELYNFEEAAKAATNEYDDGALFIMDEHFEEYVQELAEDIGAIDRNAVWPLNHIDWEAAAEELLVDYSDVKLYGNHYYVRF